MMIHLAMVFVGGGLGCVARYMITVGLQKFADIFPFGTLLANIISSLILGGILAWFALPDKQNIWYLLLAVGFCGGFSTFSTFSGDNFLLIQNGFMGQALLNIAANVALCLLAIWVGYVIVSR